MHYLKSTATVVLVMMMTTTMIGCFGIDARDKNEDGVVDRDEAISWYQDKIDYANSINTRYTDFDDSLQSSISDLDFAMSQSVPGSEEWTQLSQAKQKLESWREKSAKAIELSQSKVSELQSLIDNLPDDFDNAGAIDGAVAGEAIRTVAPLLPPPFNAIAVGLSGLIPGFGKKIYDIRNERNTLIHSIDEIKRTDPDFAQALNNNSSKMRDLQGMKLARKIDGIRSPVISAFQVPIPTPPSQ